MWWSKLIFPALVVLMTLLPAQAQATLSEIQIDASIIIDISAGETSDVAFLNPSTATLRFSAQSLSQVDPLIRLIGSGGIVYASNDNHTTALYGYAPSDAIIHIALKPGLYVLQVRDAANRMAGSVVVSVMEISTTTATSSNTDNPPIFEPELSIADPPEDRTVVPADAVLLSGGYGLSTGEPLDSGNFQVEAYCKRQGYDTYENRVDWFCTDQGKAVFTLEPVDFDIICQQSYQNPYAFALQSGTNPDPGYNWRCYAHRSYLNPQPGQLEVGERTRVFTAFDQQIRVYATPDDTANIVASIATNEIVRIRSGPILQDDNQWWEVETRSGTRGWMTRMQGSEVVLWPYD